MKKSISKNKSEKWNFLYKKYIDSNFKDWNQYYYVKMKLKKRFLTQVIKYSNSGKPILECGCGTAKTTMFLSTVEISAYAMDIEEEMVNAAKERFKNLHSDYTIIQGDIHKIPYSDKFFSVTHSSGVLEHFSDSEIIKLINEQLRVSDYCIFSVPTSYFEKKMLGNERFLKRKEWRKIINQSRAEIIKETGYHYKKIKYRIIDIIKKPKRLFKPIALYVFVLKERDD